jgi:Mg2+-importing ATPase
MWALGPVSSLFDFLTFYVLLSVLHADEALFRTGWFVESLATQVLVIFVIRTRKGPLGSAPHPALVAVCLAVVALAVALPFTPLAATLGFVAPPPAFFIVLAALVGAYLLLAEIAKRTFYRFALARSPKT